MASTLTAATLVSTISESITLNGKNQGGTTTVSIPDIKSVYKRIITCPANQTTTIATFASTVHASAGAIDVEDARYIRVTNLDATAPITLAVVGAASLYQVSLEFGRSHVLATPDGLMLAEADASPSFGTKADIASLQINPASNTVDIEIMVASI